LVTVTATLPSTAHVKTLVQDVLVRCVGSLVSMVARTAFTTIGCRLWIILDTLSPDLVLVEHAGAQTCSL
jgi:hypothetical protein